MPYRDVCEIVQQLDTAIEWLSKRGIRIPANGRFSVYQDVLGRACRARLAGRELQEIAPPPETHELFTALCEASDLWQITRLPEEQMAQNRAFVQRLVSGQSCYTQATDHDQGRDAQFQLVTAALFARGGAAVGIENPADVMAIVGQWPVAVECKRPTTLKALRNRIEDGYDQFRRHEQQGLNAVRMIGMDLSLLINPDFDVLIAQSDATAADFIDRQIHQLGERASDELDRADRNTANKARVDAFLFRVLCVIGQPGGGNERIGEFWRVAPRVAPNTQAAAALHDVVRRLPGFDRQVPD